MSIIHTMGAVIAQDRIELNVIISAMKQGETRESFESAKKQLRSEQLYILLQGQLIKSRKDQCLRFLLPEASTERIYCNPKR